MTRLWRLCSPPENHGRAMTGGHLLYQVRPFVLRTPCMDAYSVLEVADISSRFCWLISLSPALLDVSSAGEPTRHTPSLLHTPPPDLARLLRGCERGEEHDWQNR